MKNSNSHGGESFFLSGLLLLFIALKLTGHIDWSWWWVMSPIWVPLSLVVIVGVGYVIFKELRS